MNLILILQIWNYKQKKCLFTLLGHLDYIRTTFFHHVRKFNNSPRLLVFFYLTGDGVGCFLSWNQDKILWAVGQILLHVPLRDVIENPISLKDNQVSLKSWWKQLTGFLLCHILLGSTVIRNAFEPLLSSRPKCEDLLVTSGRRSLARIEPQGSLPRRGPETSILWQRFYCLAFLSYILYASSSVFSWKVLYNYTL